MEDFQNIYCVGDVVALFICKLYNKDTNMFIADSKYLKSEWLNTILKEKFNISKLSTYGFKWDSRDISAKQFGKEIENKYLNKKMFNVEEMRIFLNKKYKNYESN